MEPIFRSEVWDHMVLPMSESNEEAVCKSMASGCEAALQAYPTSLAEDIRVASSTGTKLKVALGIRMVNSAILLVSYG
jgi:hypothetical protein